ncbi:MAG TPA: hypothetical protein VMA98_08405 [Candidatus Acidoferrales bacterium]|nr:hypothetical protein [Candidatus Acidoferrales bacterium]
MSPLALAGTTFAASAVEFVEAATIVFAVGVTHGWRAAIGGALAAACTLALLVAIGSPIAANIERDVSWIQLIAGPFLIAFGAWWWRKAILRYAGRKAMHDERAIFEREVAALRAQQAGGFAVAFQGVFIEGLEVAIIVVTFAASAPALAMWSSGGALVAFLVVAAVAFALRAPLARVPENLLKTIVAVMLLALGTFWSGEGLGRSWPFGDAALALIIASYALLTVLLVALVSKLGQPSATRSRNP